MPPPGCRQDRVVSRLHPQFDRPDAPLRQPRDTIFVNTVGTGRYSDRSKRAFLQKRLKRSQQLRLEFLRKRGECAAEKSDLKRPFPRCRAPESDPVKNLSGGWQDAARAGNCALIAKNTSVRTPLMTDEEWDRDFLHASCPPAVRSLSSASAAAACWAIFFDFPWPTPTTESPTRI